MDAGSDSLQLPPSLPLLPVVNQVLLPTAFVRVQVSAKALRRCNDRLCLSGVMQRWLVYLTSNCVAGCSVALLEHFSSKSAQELLVAVVPSFAPSDKVRMHDIRTYD